MQHVRMALATGFPLDIPILTRSLAACNLARGLPLVLDFKVLEALDCGTDLADPSSLVHQYECDWWRGTVEPGDDGLLGPNSEHP
jgi:hypothetical protein